jgi:hypothetical protein
VPCQCQQHANRRGACISAGKWVLFLDAEAAMTLEEMTLALFAICNGGRIIGYVPQVLKAATDKNGASSISLATWFLFLIANLSTVAYCSHQLL